MGSFSTWRKKQNETDRKAYNREAKATARAANENKKKGAALSEERRIVNDLALNRLRYEVGRLSAINGRDGKQTEKEIKLFNKAAKAEEGFRKSALNRQKTEGRATSPSFSASRNNEKPANPFEAQRQGMTRIADARQQQKANDYLKAQQEEENKRRADLYKYGDVENMSAKEIGDRIKKLESEKQQREAARQKDATDKGYNSLGSGAGGGQISALLNKKGLSQSQLETMAKLDADADDKLEVYRKALPAATMRDEEKKLTGNDKIRLQKAADQIRHLDSVQDENGNWIPAMDPNTIKERNNKARASVEDLKKRGVDTDYLIEAYGTQMDNEDAKKAEADFKEWAGQNALTGILASAGTIAMSPITYITDAAEDAYHAVRNTVSDKPVELNQKRRGLGNLSQAMREGVSENIENPVWNFVYNAGMSTGDSLMAIATGNLLGGAAAGTKVTQAIMSVGAADQTYNEAIERGLDPMHALATAITAGVTEWVTEKYSIDGFKKMALKRPENLKALVTNIGKQMATEGSEEAASDVLNTIADNAINGKKSEYNQSVKRYMEQGLTQQQAKKAAMMDWLSNTAYDAAAGAFSGALMGAGGQAMSYSQTQNDIERYGGNIKKGGDLKAVIDYAKKFEGLEKLVKKADKTANDSKTVGQIAEAVEKKVNERIEKAETAEELGRVYEELRDEAPDTVGIQIDAAVREKAAKLTEEAKEEEKGALEDLKGIAEESLANTSERMGERIKENENEERETIYDETTGRTYEVEPKATLQGMDMGEEVSSPVETEQKTSNEGISERAEAPLRILNHRAATLDASGEKVTIEGIEGTGTDNVRLKIDGSTDEVPLQDVHFENRAVEQIYKVAATMDDAAAATAMISNYDGKQDTRTYALDFDRAYNWGSAMLSYDSLRKKFAFSTPEHIVKMAYYLGQNAGEQNFDEARRETKAIKEGKRSFKKGTGEAIDERTDEYAKGDIYSHIDKAMAKKLGITVRAVDDIKADEKETVGTINGYFDAANAEMRFSDLAESKLGVRIHESMEFLEKMDPDLYKMTVGAVLKFAMDSNGAKSIYDEIINYRNTYRDVEGKKTFAEATEEYINDAISGAFMSEEGAKDFINWLGKENFTTDEKKGILKTIADIINGLIEKIKDALNMGGLTKAQQKIANTSLERQQMIRQIFTQAMDSAINNYQGTAAGETQAAGKAASVAHALKVGADVSDKRIENNRKDIMTMRAVYKAELNSLDRYGNEKKEDNIKDFFGETKTVDTEDFGEVLLGNRSVKDITFHGGKKTLKYTSIAAVPSVLKKGKTCYVRYNQDGTVERAMIAAPIEITGAEKSGEYLVGAVVAVSPQTNRLYLVEVVSTEKEEDLSLGSPNPVFSTKGNEKSPSTLSILYDMINVNRYGESGEKISRSAEIPVKDMTDKQLDKEYAAAVESKDEKRQAELVREAANRAGYDSPVLYHGTEKTGFTEFDLGKMDDGISIFTTESADMAAGYSGRKVIKTLEAAKNKANGEEVFKRGDKEEILNFFRNNLSNDAEYATRLDLKDDTTYSMQSVKSAARSIENLLGEYEDGSEDHKNAKAVAEALKVFENWYDTKTEEQMEKFDLEKALEQYNEAYEKAPEKVSDVLIRKGLAGELSFIVKKSTDDPQEYIKLKDEGRGLIDVDTLTFMSTDPGIYKMYGKTDNMLIIDGKGNSWKEIPIPQAIKNEIGDDLATTRELSQFAKDKGYNGVVIENIVDNGGKWTDSRGYDKSTVRIFFNPSDVKSADNVTYDEEGKAIPLSERFNEEKKDLRLSVKVDSHGRNLSEQQKEYFKDSKVVDDEGRLLVLYHGTEAEPFTEFNTYGAWLTPDIDYAREYAGRWNSFAEGLEREEGRIENEIYNDKYARTYEVYANITNPLEIGQITRRLSDYAYQGFSQAIGIDNIEDFQALRKMVEDLKGGETWELTNSKGFIDLVKKYGYDGMMAWEKDSRTYCSFARTFHPEQIKSVKNKKPTTSPDIRYSVKVADLEQRAADYFGTTDDIRFAGYMLPDGRMLDFSGAHWLDSEKEKENFRKTNTIRTVEHYDIQEIEDTDYEDFVNRGNIRLTPESSGFNLSAEVEPTPEQYRALKEYIREIKKNPDFDGDTILVDIGTGSPKKLEYHGNINEDRIINDIKEYYKTGEIKEQSELERFRYSLADTKETTDLLKENKDLREMVDNLKKEFELTGGTMPDPKKIKSAARKILKKYSSDFDLDTLTENISNVYSYLRQDGADFDEAVRVMSEIARGVLERTEIKDDSMSKQYEDLKKQIKAGVNFTDLQREELAHAGGITSYTHRTGIRSSKQTIDLDRQWAEWSSLYPELFPANTNEGDMPFVLEGVLEAISPQIETLSGETIDQMAYDVAMQIYSEIAKVPVKETFADQKEREKYEALRHVSEKYEDLVEAYRRNNAAQNEEELKETLEQVKKERAQRIARLTDEINDLNQAKKYAGNPKTLEQYKKEMEKKGAEIARLKSQNETKIAELRQKYQGQRVKVAETRRQTETKDKIRRLHEKFRRMILKPTETMHVPAELMQSAIEVCEVVNLGAKKGTKLFDALYDAERAFGAIKADTENYGIDDFDPRIAGDLARLTDLFHDKGDDWSIYDMTSAELQQVYDAMSEIYESIRLSTKLIREEGEKDVRRAGKRVIKELQQSKGVKDHWWSRAANKVSSTFLNSYREFRRLSGYNDNSEIMDMWRELNEGQRRQYQIQMEGENFLQNATTAEGMEELMKEIDSDKALVKVPLRFESGNAPVMVTKGMRLAIILHGMSAANRLHMMEGGMMIPADMSKYKSDKKKAYEKTRKVVGITNAALMQMQGELSAKERKLLETFADFFHNWTGDLVNKTSMELYGFKKARVENYYPISVDKSFVTTDISALKFDKTIEGAGFLKERVRSVKPMILESVIDTADRSLNAVSMFAGLAIPIRNFNKIMNVSTYKATEGDSEALGGKGWTVDTSVKREIKEIWGDRTQKYIDDMLADLQQARRHEATLYDKLRGNYAGAVLTANASVIIKQTSAYPMCAAITGWSPTLKAMFRGGKHNWILSKADQDLINEYTPIYWERNKGNSTRELAEIREYGTGITKLAPVRLVKDAIQKVDMAMVGRFWYAAQYYVNSTQKDLAKKFKADPTNKRLRDLYYTEVAKVFDRCVEETQSTNMTLQNADIMRNTNAGTKIITMFMGQGLQNFGIVYDNLNNLRAKRAQYKNGQIEKEDFTQAKKDLANAISSQLVSAAVFAGLAIVARALLHRMNPYRDDKEEITGETILAKWGDDFLDNVIGSVPLGSLAYEWASAAISAATGNGWVRPYGQNDIVLQSLSDLESSTVNLFKAISKGEGIGEAINDVAKDGSKLFGVPWENVSNIFEGTMKHIQDVTEGEGPLSFTSDQKNPAAAKVINYLTEAIQQKNDAAVEKYVEMLYDLGKNAKDINGLLAKPLKQDETVKEAAAAKEQGDLVTYEKTITDFEKKGYPRDAVIKAINGIITANKKKKEEKPDPEVTKERALETAGSLYGSLKINEEKLYKSNDLQAAVETGKGVDAVVKEILKEKLNTGIEKDEAIKKVSQSIKTSLSKVYKNAYFDGNAHERTQIIKKLQRIKLDGKVLYDQDYFLKWNKEADKQKKA